MATLKQRLDAHVAASADKIPADVRAIMTHATQSLRDSGILDRVITPGTTLPAFALVDSTGTERRSHDALANGPLVLTFYRGVW